MSKQVLPCLSYLNSDEDLNFLGHKHRFKGDKPRSQSHKFTKTNLPRDWSESFGTLNVTRDPTLEDVLFSRDTLERYNYIADIILLPHNSFLQAATFVTC